MKKCDIAICLGVIFVGLVRFAGAEIAYDGGSPMENQALRCGVLAVIYVPLATMYLIKVARGDGYATAVVAWLIAFLVLWIMVSVDVWVTHFKPNCDICHIPAKVCFVNESIASLIVTVLAGFADIVSSRMVRKVSHPFARLWIVRRIMRVVVTVLLTWLLCVLTYWVLYALIRFLVQCN